MMLGIDVSENNPYVDWDDVKEAGVQFAIVRSSYGKTNRDEKFEEHVHGAHSVGLQVGAYHYSYGLTPSDALREAENCKRVIDEAGVLLELPVWFDMEDADGYKQRHSFDFSRRNITAMCHAFLDGIKPLDCGVYASKSWLDSWIDWRSLGCAVWNAEWMNGYNPEPDTDEDSLQGYMWQYTDKKDIGGRIFDGNVLYLDC